MGRAKCGCMQWGTASGDTEEYICRAHRGPTICFISGREDCKHLHIESEDECWCNHPNLDGRMEDYCPLDEEVNDDSG